MLKKYRFFKNQRLSGKPAFSRVFDAGNRQSSYAITLLNAPNSLEYARFGFIVSKKVSKKAVERNRVRRVIRESLRQRSDLAGYDWVILARYQAADCDNDKIRQDLDKCLARLQNAASN